MTRRRARRANYMHSSSPPRTRHAPEVECDVRKWLLQRLNGLYYDLQLMYIPHVHSIIPARTHIVLNNALGTVKALIKATGLNPHLSVYGWPLCLDDVDAAEGVAA